MVAAQLGLVVWALAVGASATQTADPVAVIEGAYAAGDARPLLCPALARLVKRDASSRTPKVEADWLTGPSVAGQSPPQPSVRLAQRQPLDPATPGRPPHRVVEASFSYVGEVRVRGFVLEQKGAGWCITNVALFPEHYSFTSVLSPPVQDPPPHVELPRMDTPAYTPISPNTPQ